MPVSMNSPVTPQMLAVDNEVPGGTSLEDFVKQVRWEGAENSDYDLVLTLLRENKIKEVKHLEYVTRHDLVFPTGFPGGLRGFVKKLFLVYEEQFGGSDDEPMQPQQPEAGAERLEKALLAAMGKANVKPQWEQVDLEKRMKELKLDQLFPEEAGWPQMNAVYELATRMKKSVRDSGDNDWVPWVSFEMKRFLPDCFQEYLVTHFEVEDDKQPKANSRRLELASWMAAWDGFSVAAAVLGLMTYAETRLHRKMVLEVACLGVADGRTALMGVLYDEILRKEWEELSAKKHSFKVGTQVGEIQDRAMRRAVSLHDTLLGIPHEKAEAARKRKLGEAFPKKAEAAIAALLDKSCQPWDPRKVRTPKRKQRSKENVRCYKCNQLGHFAFECPNPKPPKTQDAEGGPNPKPKRVAQPKRQA